MTDGNMKTGDEKNLKNRIFSKMNSYGGRISIENSGRSLKLFGDECVSCYLGFSLLICLKKSKPQVFFFDPFLLLFYLSLSTISGFPFVIA